MYSGILNAAYDFELIIKTAKKLEINNKIRFVIRGVGRTEDRVKELIKKYKPTNVVFNTEFLKVSELIATLAQADVFILPMKGHEYTEHGLPTKLFEYQSYGRPIICASIGESAKYVERTESGIVIPVGDVNALYDTVVRLYEDEALLKRLGDNGKSYVEKSLVSERLGERMSKTMTESYRS
jgi:glycosyltransferase involved in cell wall biosynthesis